MSADQWRVCPRCFARETNEWIDKTTFVANAYGQVPADEWMALAEEAESFRPTTKPFELEGRNSTLRINYEAYFEGGHSLCFNYSAYCVRDGCGWKMDVRDAWPVADV